MNLIVSIYISLLNHITPFQTCQALYTISSTCFNLSFRDSNKSVRLLLDILTLFSNKSNLLDRSGLGVLSFLLALCLLTRSLTASLLSFLGLGSFSKAFNSSLITLSIRASYCSCIINPPFVTFVTYVSYNRYICYICIL